MSEVEKACYGCISVVDELSNLLELCSTIADDDEDEEDKKEEEEKKQRDGVDDNDYCDGHPAGTVITRETSFLGLVTLHALPIDALVVQSRRSKAA